VSSKYLISTLVTLASSVALAQAVPRAKNVTAQKATGHSVLQAPQQHQDEGTRIFQQNCSRCHNTPEGFSPSISGTVVRHMRVRASLSKQDEEALLRFLNP
jgi:cytochrome c5